MNPENPSKEWENSDGSTNTDGFLKAFAENDNTFWRMEPGHALNVIEELIERLESLQSQNSTLLSLVRECKKALEYCAIDPGYLQPLNNRQCAVASNTLSLIEKAGVLHD